MRDPRDSARRGAALVGAFVGAALAIFAGTSLATAELKQNAVEQSLEAGAAASCDVVADPNCDGVDDGGATADPSADAAGDGALATDPVATDAAADGVAPTTPGAATSTAPTTTTAEPAVIENLALGDSVMLGAAGQLTEIGYTVDARESRQFSDGLDTIAALNSENRLGQRVVVHLGTNGPIGASDLTAMMNELSGVPQVVLVTNDVDRDYTADNNALLYDAASTFANVELLEWQGLASSCPGNCFYDDGIHLRPDGQVYYATLVGSVTALA